MSACEQGGQDSPAPPESACGKCQRAASVYLQAESTGSAARAESPCMGGVKSAPPGQSQRRCTHREATIRSVRSHDPCPHIRD